MADNPSQAQLQALSNEYQKLQEDLQNTVAARQKLDAQQQENFNVQKEFKKLKDESKVYKLVGPVLLKQEHTEANSAIDGRLEYIGRSKRREGQLKDLQERSDQKRTQVIQLQTQIQQQQQQSGAEQPKPA